MPYVDTRGVTLFVTETGPGGAPPVLFLNSLGTTHRMASGAATVADTAAIFAGLDADGYADCCEAIAGMDLFPLLGAIRAPATIVCGKEDPATPPEMAHALRAGIAGSRVVELSPAAHLLATECPAQASEIVRATVAAARWRKGHALPTNRGAALRVAEFAAQEGQQAFVVRISDVDARRRRLKMKRSTSSLVATLATIFKLVRSRRLSGSPATTPLRKLADKVFAKEPTWSMRC